MGATVSFIVLTEAKNQKLQLYLYYEVVFKLGGFPIFCHIVLIFSHQIAVLWFSLPSHTGSSIVTMYCN
jgi:hypothetical protein